MDLIIQVNPPTFLCSSSHRWASEDDERWVGRKGKGGRHRVAQAIEKAALLQGAAAPSLPFPKRKLSQPNATHHNSACPYQPSWPILLGFQDTFALLYLLWREFPKILRKRQRISLDEGEQIGDFKILLLAFTFLWDIQEILLTKIFR